MEISMSMFADEASYVLARKEQVLAKLELNATAQATALNTLVGYKLACQLDYLQRQQTELKLQLESLNNL